MIDVKVGMNVVVNLLEDAQVYQVEAIKGNWVHITYKRADGQMVKPFTLNPAALIKPTKTQLKNLGSN